jgi:hypothetical protein
MSTWKEDPRLPFLLSAVLGLIAGVAAKQAVSIQAGQYPRPVSILADFLVLGMVLLIVMYVHAIRPQVPLEGIALLSAALAMWGPRGIAALLNRFKKGALSAAESAARTFLDPVEPVRRPTVAEAVEEEKVEAMDPARENTSAKKAPVRRLRDVLPVEDKLPVDEVQLIAEVDKAVPHYHWIGKDSKKGKPHE